MEVNGEAAGIEDSEANIPHEDQSARGRGCDGRRGWAVPADETMKEVEPVEDVLGAQADEFFDIDGKVRLLVKLCSRILKGFESWRTVAR